jgi:hypothetical protein
VGPGFIKDGDMQGLSEGLRQQLDEGKWLCVFGGGGVLMRSSGVVEGACCL